MWGRKRWLLVKWLIYFSIPVVSLTICHMQRYTFLFVLSPPYHNSPILSSLLPLTQQFHEVAPSFHCLFLKLQGPNKWLCWHTERLSVNIAGGDLGTKRTASCFASFPSKILFLLVNPTLALRHPNNKLPVMASVIRSRMSETVHS